MWYSVGIVLFVVGAVCVVVAGSLVLDTLATNKRGGLPWHEDGVGGWMAMGVVGAAFEIAGFVLALWAA
jgi:hypothetical protein